MLTDFGGLGYSAEAIVPGVPCPDTLEEGRSMANEPRAETPQVIPYLYYEDAGSAIEFMKTAFGFEVESCFRNPGDGSVLHAQVSTGTGLLFVGPGMGAFGTRAVGDADSVSAMIYVFVEDVEAHYQRARQAGAAIREKPHVHAGGNRQYTASDPGGQRWTFAQTVEVSDGDESLPAR